MSSSLAASGIEAPAASLASAWRSLRTICSGECRLPIKSPPCAHLGLLDSHSNWISIRGAGQFLFVHAFVPNIDVVIVGSIPGVSLIRARCDKHHGVRIAVNARVVEVGVVYTTVLVPGMVDEGNLVGGLAEVGILGIVRCLQHGVFECCVLGRANGFARVLLSLPPEH